MGARGLTRFVQAITGSKGAERRAEQARQAADRDRELARIAQERQAAAQQESAQTDARKTGGGARVARGRRLLIAPEAGGLASTFGGM